MEERTLSVKMEDMEDLGEMIEIDEFIEMLDNHTLPTDPPPVTFPLAGKVALVTGGARGIGRAIALELAKRGATVVISYVSSVRKALDVVDIITRSGGRAAALISDVSKPEEIDRLFRIVLGAFKGIDIVVNNAAVLEVELLENLTEESFDRVFGTNSKGAFFVAKHAALHMREGGRIINISTSATSIPMAGYATYLASKATLEVLTRVLAKELAPKKITVNTVSPGYTRTDMSVWITDAVGRKASVFDRWGDPEEIAYVVSFLASEEARSVTGQNLLPNGGQVMLN